VGLSHFLRAACETVARHSSQRTGGETAARHDLDDRASTCSSLAMGISPPRQRSELRAVRGSLASSLLVRLDLAEHVSCIEPRLLAGDQAVTQIKDVKHAKTDRSAATVHTEECAFDVTAGT